MCLAAIKKSIEEILSSNPSEIDAEKAYSLSVEFIKEFAKIVDKRFEDAEWWHIEVLDDAVDIISDKLGSIAAIYEVWDAIWDAKIERKKVSVETLRKLLRIIELAERMCKMGKAP
jgi:hypothetical protein